MIKSMSTLKLKPELKRYQKWERVELLTFAHFECQLFIIADPLQRHFFKFPSGAILFCGSHGNLEFDLIQFNKKN